LALASSPAVLEARRQGGEGSSKHSYEFAALRRQRDEVASVVVDERNGETVTYAMTETASIASRPHTHGGDDGFMIDPPSNPASKRNNDPLAIASAPQQHGGPFGFEVKEAAG
jgi:hypothetical protein